MDGNFNKVLEYSKNQALSIFDHYSIPRWTVFLLDNIAVLLTFILSFLLRFNFVINDFLWEQVFFQALITNFIYAMSFLYFRSYAGIIRHTTITDIFNVFVASGSSFLVIILISSVARGFDWPGIFIIPYSIILIHFATIIVVLFCMRILIKIIFRFASNPVAKSKNVLIYGADDLGYAVKEVFINDPSRSFKVVGFIDKNKRLRGKKIDGLSVYSPVIISTGYLTRNKIEILVLAVNNISPKEKSEIIRSALGCNLTVLKTPSVKEWKSGGLRLHQLQRIELEDLLGRDPIKLNLNLIGQGLFTKVVLVTGAAGSIGSEIVRQLTRFEIKKVILVDQAETPLFNLENEIKKNYTFLEYIIVLADITNSAKMEWIFREYNPQIIFHAAAYKHVPILEDNVHEAIRVNIGGTMLLTTLAENYKTEKFVMISTDKSVNPTSIMGASKRICEMIVQSKTNIHNPLTQFVITRFGNVLGSNGSVIPIFSKQIEEGGPVTVTHPDITRYFMTIPEACELVLEAGFMGKGGEIFEFDMGKPVRIADMAAQMIGLSGLLPGKDIRIEYTGLRPGEKLYEELHNGYEKSKQTYHPKISIAYAEDFNSQDVLDKIGSLIKNLYTLSREEVINSFEAIVPEYKCFKEKDPVLPIKNIHFNL